MIIKDLYKKTKLVLGSPVPEWGGRGEVRWKLQRSIKEPDLQDRAQ